MKFGNELELILPWLHNASLAGDEEKRAREFVKSQGQAGVADKQLDDVLQSILKQKGIKSPGQLGWFRLQRDIANLPQEKSAANKSIRWIRPAMAAALFVIIIQGGFIMNTLQQPTTYAPLAQQQNYTVVLQIEFQPDATEERIRKLLGLVDGRLIDGPGAIGLYRISLGLLANDEEAIDNRIKILKTYSGVVRHVSRD